MLQSGIRTLNDSVQANGVQTSVPTVKRSAKQHLPNNFLTFYSVRTDNYGQIRYG